MAARYPCSGCGRSRIMRSTRMAVLGPIVAARLIGLAGDCRAPTSAAAPIASEGRKKEC